MSRSRFLDVTNIIRSSMGPTNRVTVSARQSRPFSSLKSFRRHAVRGTAVFPFEPIHISPFLQFPSIRNFASPSFTKPIKNARRKRKFVPRKAAVELTEKARNFFKALIESSPGKDGIILNYQQASSGQPRMVFSFGFVTKEEITSEDEGVSLELLEDGTPKSPRDSVDDGLPKLYVHHNAFLKVLGATLDVDTETITPILYDKEGNRMDPNA